MSAYSRDIGSVSSWTIEATRRMNRMYRRQRHIYDGTRRCYLLGRDQMIAELRPNAGAINEFGAAQFARTFGPWLNWYVPLKDMSQANRCEARIFKSGRTVNS